MQVTIIGSGNVATVMGRVLKTKGHTIRHIYSRHLPHAVQLAEELGAKAVADLRALDQDSDLYIIAVTDDVMEELAAGLSFPNKLVVHTAGAVSIGILKNTSSTYGVIWPMKMLRKNMSTLEPVTMVVDGNSETTVEQLKEIAGIFSSSVLKADDEKRLKLHMLASVTLNFSNHLFRLAADYCSAENIDFRLFYPLIEASVQRLATHHPRDLQAGPAYRGEVLTIEKHRSLLAHHPAMEEVYRVMTESIRSFSGRNQP